MTDRPQRHWTIWTVSLAVFLALLVAGHMASTARTTVLALQPGVKAELIVFSPLGHDIYFDLSFARAAAKGSDDALRSQELGGPRHNGKDAVEILPGQPVVIEASLEDGSSVRLRATPANRFDRFTIGRSLRADGIAGLSFPPNERDGISALRVHPGVNRVNLRVLQVGGTLHGEYVQLIAQPPMRAGGPQPGYGVFVAIFWLLPVALMAFIITGMALLVRATRSKGYRDTLAGGD